MMHEAPCSVLIAHADVDADGDVVVGFDGSGGARRALAAGRELSERLGLGLRVIVASGDAHPPGPGWSREELGPELAVSEDPRSAVEALVDASRSARLLVVGSRHLRGVPALSSVSERAAHRASSPCSSYVDSAVRPDERRCSERYLGPGMVHLARSRHASACAALTLRLANVISRAIASMSRWRRGRGARRRRLARRPNRFESRSASAAAYTTAERCAAGITASSARTNPFELVLWHAGAQRPCLVRRVHCRHALARLTATITRSRSAGSTRELV